MIRYPFFVFNLVYKFNDASQFNKYPLYTRKQNKRAPKCRDAFLAERIFHSSPEKRAFRSSSEICAPHLARFTCEAALNAITQAKKKGYRMVSFLFWLGCRDFVLDFCSTFGIYFNVMFRKNLRSPFKNSPPDYFFTAFESQSIPVFKTKNHPIGWLFILAGVQGFEPRKCQSQSLMPYRLATPQYFRLCYYITPFFICQVICKYFSIILHFLQKYPSLFCISCPLFMQKHSV